MKHLKLNHFYICLLICLFAYLLICLFLPKQTKADTLQKASDTLGTSVAGAKSTHTISFTTINPVPAGGKILILFPNLALGDSYKSGTSSASTFMLNSITDNYVKIFGLSGSGTFTGNYKDAVPGSPGVSITLTLTGGTGIAAKSTITLLLGCTSANLQNTACTSPTPIIYNPFTGTGSENVWVIRVKTQDNSGNTLDTTRLRVGTNNGIAVFARISQNFMMLIEGVLNNTLIQSNNSKCIDNPDKTDSGVDSTGTSVSLGSIPINDITIAAQDITVGTNGASGYVIIATSSSSLKSPQTGFSFKTSLLPVTINIGKNFFGIHPCGADVDAVVWGSRINRYAWPGLIDSFYQPIRLASHPTSRSLTKTTVEYAATTDNSVPAGSYSTTLMYTAMPIF